MPNANDYIQKPDGTWSKINPQPLNPILKSDGWIPKSTKDNNTNHPSYITTSPGKLRVISAQEAMDVSPYGIRPLWGTFLHPKSIGLLSSVSGAGKTTLCYSIAIHGARGETFANIPFPRPLNVLYIDLETGQELRAIKLRRICEDNPPENLYFISILNFIYDYKELSSIVTEYLIDLLIVDTINEAFNTRDEQDNAEANRQFAFIKRLRDETGCAILLLAHIGKGIQLHGVYKTRGASARAASVDVVLNLEEKTQDEICLSKEKDRIVGGKEKLYLRKAGEDAFEVIEKGEDLEINLLIRAENLVLSALGQGMTKTREFVERGQQNSYSKPTIERALHNLIDLEKVERIKKGEYRKKSDNTDAIGNSKNNLSDNGGNLPSNNPSITNDYRGDGIDGLSTESNSINAEE